MNDQLRRRSVGAPAARSMLLTVLGEHVLPLGPRAAVWQEALVGALEALGYGRHAARQAVARSVRDGWLTSERDGRRARMRLTEQTRELLVPGSRRIYAFGAPFAWDGRWLLVLVRVAEEHREARHRLRTQLAWAGLGSLGGGVWLTPHTDREPEVGAATADVPAAEVTSFVARLGALGDPQRVVRAAWDLDAIAADYRAFLDEFRRLRPATDAAAFRALTSMVHAWRRFPFLDPDLPPALLPARWPKDRAHALFHERHERWRAASDAHLRALLGDDAAALSAAARG